MSLWNRAHPGLFYGPWWPTRDHIVPWTVFWCLFRRLGNQLTLDRAELAMGASLGIGLATGKKGSDTQRLVETMLRKAFT